MEQKSRLAASSDAMGSACLSSRPVKAGSGVDKRLVARMWPGGSSRKGAADQGFSGPSRHSASHLVFTRTARASGKTKSRAAGSARFCRELKVLRKGSCRGDRTAAASFQPAIPGAKNRPPKDARPNAAKALDGNFLCFIDEGLQPRLHRAGLKRRPDSAKEEAIGICC